MKVDFGNDNAGHVCKVLDVAESPVTRYNKGVADELAIMAGDYIVAINDSAGMTHAMEAIRQTSVTLTVARAQVFERTVEKAAGQELGLELKSNATAVSLFVASVHDGAVRSEEVDILPGDRILEVNGVSAVPLDMLSVLRDSTGPLVMKVSRPHSVS